MELQPSHLGKLAKVHPIDQSDVCNYSYEVRIISIEPFREFKGEVIHIFNDGNVVLKGEILQRVNQEIIFKQSDITNIEN